jgi:hypothetical protein
MAGPLGWDGVARLTNVLQGLYSEAESLCSLGTAAVACKTTGRHIADDNSVNSTFSPKIRERYQATPEISATKIIRNFTQCVFVG